MVHPARDRNIVYTFHFYEPATFTHQGAVWWVDGLDRYMADLPYPSTSSQCPAAAAKFTNADVRHSALSYCAANWGSTKVDNLIGQAARWGQVHQVPVIADEFGAYCGHVRQADRLTWFRTVRSALERDHIGWTLWGYDDCYGLGRRVDGMGHITIDWGVAQALGLRTSVRT
jgi:hypothetical protein